MSNLMSFALTNEVEQTLMNICLHNLIRKKFVIFKLETQKKIVVKVFIKNIFTLS